jgi:hypothetical protein
MKQPCRLFIIVRKCDCRTAMHRRLGKQDARTWTVAKYGWEVDGFQQGVETVVDQSPTNPISLSGYNQVVGTRCRVRRNGNLLNR